MHIPHLCIGATLTINTSSVVATPVPRNTATCNGQTSEISHLQDRGIGSPGPPPKWLHCANDKTPWRFLGIWFCVPTWLANPGDFGTPEYGKCSKEAEDKTDDKTDGAVFEILGELQL